MFTKNILLILIVVTTYILFFPALAAAQQSSIPHFTVILNQVRGPECCDSGNIGWFRQQQTQLRDNNLVGNFALRYDAVMSDGYLKLVEEDTSNKYGALFEVTPQLAKDAGVAYKSDPARWYEAQNVYLIGYTQDERQKLIDTYMATFKDRLGYYPEFSSAWMIDAWSLTYLKKNYGITAHQITREQFGTDSYTLYGGPYHYPYYPSSNWAMIPQMGNTQMPLIIRQTISDPVYVYGDKTDSYTSQPNDYYIRDDTTEYFSHLFLQAHDQQDPYTFALLGLENTMPEGVQSEFGLQLIEVQKWQQQSENNSVVSVVEFENWLNQNRGTFFTSYDGSAATNDNEKAWWINSPSYRARVRLSNGQLFISDLRIYSSAFKDPYFQDTAKNLGWWVVPFVLDGSRYFSADSDGILIKNDTLKNRAELGENPTRIILAENVTEAALTSNNNSKTIQANGSDIVTFTPTQINLVASVSQELSFAPENIVNLNWNTETDQSAWGFYNANNSLLPFVQNSDLDQAREQFRSLLFPEKKFETMNADKSYLYINNRYAIANRNPVRIVLFPKNSEGEAILLPTYPKVVTNPAIDEIDIHEQHQSNGMVFIDLDNKEPLAAKLTIEQDDFNKELTVYFAPNCKNEVLYCLTHPIKSWWYIRSVIGDKLRAMEEKRQKDASFADQQ